MCLEGSVVSSRGQQSEEVVAGVGRVLCYFSCRHIHLVL